MALILGIEASTTSGSVALLQDNQVIGSQQYEIDKSHSSLLHVMIQQLMENVGLAMSALDAVAIAEGPGSYTGLRIGTSTAKGLCYALDIPLIAVNTLEGLAYQVYRINQLVDRYCPMLDARRMEVYTMMLDKDFNVIKPTAPVILDESSFVADLESNKILFFGDGSGKLQGICQHPNAIYIADIKPSAIDIALLAKTKFEKKIFENVITFEPFYLKEFRMTTPKKTWPAKS